MEWRNEGREEELEGIMKQKRILQKGRRERGRRMR